MGDLPTAEDLRICSDALDAGTVRPARADDEPPEGWQPSPAWRRGGMWLLLPASRGRVIVTSADDGISHDWCLPPGYPDDAVHRAPSLRVAQYRAEAALRAAGEQVPR